MRRTLIAFMSALLLPSIAHGQGTITTIAGGGPDQIPALSANLSHPVGMAFDGHGNLYVAVSNASRVYKIDPSGNLTVVAGNGFQGFSGDGGPAIHATLNQPFTVALDSSGNLYIADTANNRIRRVDASTQAISTYAGSGTQGFSGDGGPATAAQFRTPQGLAIGADGDLFVADLNNHRIRRINAATQVITTFAGTGAPAFAGDGGLAIGARFNQPYALAFDAAGNLYVNDRSNRRIRRIAAATTVITTVAGNGISGIHGDGGPATSASLFLPDQLAIDAAGNLLIAETFSHRVRRVDASTGIIMTIAGNGVAAFAGDGGPALGAALQHPRGLALSPSGELLISDSSNFRLRLINAGSNISTIAGNGTHGFGGDGFDALRASINTPLAVLVAPNGDIFIGDFANHRVRRIDAVTGNITTVAGNGTPGLSGDGGPAISAMINGPGGFTLDLAGRLLFSDFSNQRVRRVDLGTGMISTVPGTIGKTPLGIATAASGDLILADQGGRRIWRIDSLGNATVVAGTGASCSPSTAPCGDGGPATAASLGNAQGLALDAAGNIYYADANLNRVRRIDAGTGVITTVAGNGNFGSTGNGGPATAAPLATPTGVAFDSSGNLFIGENNGAIVRRVDAGTGIISIAAGSTFGFAGDGGSSLLAKLASPRAVAFDAAGRLYIADQTNHRIRRVDQRNPLPTLTSITPASRMFGGPAFTLTVHGQNFVYGAVVRFNGMDRVTTYLSPTQLTAQILASDLTTAGSFPVTVFNPAPDGGLSNPLNFAVQRTSSLVISCSPAFPIPINSPTTCTATVTDTGTGPGSAPMGSVGPWFEVNSLPGSFNPTSCTLVPVNATQSTCSVTFTVGINIPTNSYRISATYTGDHANTLTTPASITPVRRTESSSIDCVPNPMIAGSTTTCTVTVTDTDAPTFVPPTGAVSWNKSQPTGSFSASSCALAGSGVSVSCSVTYSQTSVGNSTISTVHDAILPVSTNDRNHTGSSTSVVLSVISPDSTPPVIAPSVSGTLGDNGWYTGNVSVAWTVTDAESTVSSTTGCGAMSVTADTSGVTFTCEATSAGGTAAQSITVKRDATPPVPLFVGRTAPNGAGWNNTNVTASWSCSDLLSGPTSATITQAVTAEGANQSATGSCFDQAGNSAADTQTGISIDKTAPDVACGVADGAWHAADVSIACTASDATSGLASAADASFALSTAVPAGTETANVSTDSRNVCDLAGNCSNAGPVSGNYVDKKAPAITGTASPAANGFGWNNTDVAVSFTCTDGGAGLAAGSPPAATVLAAEGAGQSVTSTCSDLVGNSASATVGGINIDKTAPVVTGTPSRPADSNGWYNHALSVAWSATDALSGVHTCGAPMSYSGPDSPSASLSGSCSDKAGNAATGLTSLQYDATPPAIAITTPPNNATYLLGSSAAASYSCSDATAGVASCVGPVASGANINTSSVGPGTFTVNASDLAGNTASSSTSYSVVYSFFGFLQPIDNLPVVNSASGGRTIPVKWRLLNASGGVISSLSSFTSLLSAPIACDASPSAVVEEQLVAPGDTTVRFEGDYFIFNWKTTKGWSGCRILQLTLADGTMKYAKFQFR